MRASPYRQAVCEMLSEVAYQPALDAEGRPVPSFIQDRHAG
jgi:hypothetical protein